MIARVKSTDGVIEVRGRALRTLVQHLEARADSIERGPGWTEYRYLGRDGKRHRTIVEEVK